MFLIYLVLGSQTPQLLMCLLFGQTVKTKGLEVLSWKRFVINCALNISCSGCSVSKNKVWIRNFIWYNYKLFCSDDGSELWSMSQSHKFNDSKFVLCNFHFQYVLLDESKMKTIFAMSFHFGYFFIGRCLDWDCYKN